MLAPVQLLDVLRSAAEVRTAYVQSPVGSVKSVADHAFIASLIGSFEPDVLLMNEAQRLDFLSICKQLNVRPAMVSAPARRH